MFDPKDYQIIDLSLAYDQGIAGYQATTARTLERDGWNALNLSIYSHAGTHMDAPLHFGVSEASIDEYPVQQLIGKAWVATIPIHEDQQLLKVSDLGDIPSRFQAGDSLILRTHWSQYLGQEKYRHQLPRISEGLAQWCVAHRVNMLGVEPPSVADVNNLVEVTLIHKILLGGNIIIIEGLSNLERIQGEWVWLLALPLKIKGGDGAPARVIAFDPI